MTEFVFNESLCPSALLGINSNPVMTIIMIITSNRGKSCDLDEGNLEDLC